MILTVHRHSVTSEDVEPQCELSGCRDSVSSYWGCQATVLVVTEVVKTVWPVNMLLHSENCQVVEPWHEICLVCRAIVWVVMLNHTMWVIRLWSQMWVCQVAKSNVSLSGCRALVWAVMSSHTMWVVRLSGHLCEQWQWCQVTQCELSSCQANTSAVRLSIHSVSSDATTQCELSGCQSIVWAMMSSHIMWVVRFVRPQCEQ